jgi:hypothetical protein
VSWCFMRFSEEDDLVAYAKPTGFLEALSIWTSPVSMAGLEAAIERIQNLRDNHLAAHHMVKSFVRHNILLLQWRSCPHWEVLSRNHPMRLHHDNPSEVEILRVSNFLTSARKPDGTIEASTNPCGHPFRDQGARGHHRVHAPLRLVGSHCSSCGTRGSRQRGK